MKKKIRISQAMIVKNEEKNIERALSWGRDYLYEQIVVDTGSSDRTVEIAKSLGANVFSFPWINDFSAAKNFAIEKCTGDWIAFLDADEYFNIEEARLIPKYILDADSKGGEGIFTMLVNLDEEGKASNSASQIRIFKNIKSLRYKRRIHEQLCHEDGHNIIVLDATQKLTIWHTGYAGEAAREKQKSNRNLNMILKEIEDYPNAYDMYIHLGNEYFGRENYEQAKKAYDEYINHLPQDILGTDADAANAFLHRFYCLLKLNKDIKTIVDTYNDSIVRVKENADIPYIMGQCLYDAKLYGECVQCLREALRRLETFGTLNRSQIAMQNINLIYEMLADSCLKIKDVKAAVKYASTLLSANKYSVKGLLVILRAFKGDDNNHVPIEDVIRFLSKIYIFSDMKDIELLKSSAQAIGYNSFLEKLSSL